MVSDSVRPARLRPATPDEVQPIEALLRRAGLPVAGASALVRAPHVLIAAVDDDRLLGAVGVEAHGPQRLLRSLVVDERARSGGLGRRLVDAAVAASADRQVVLLTETAEEFFARLGFVAVDRTVIDGPLTTSEEWTTLCADQATAMVWAGAPSAGSDPRRDPVE